jgi:hypothetical protein
MDVYQNDALDLKQRALVALSVVKRQRTEAASAESVIGGLPAEGRYRDLALTSFGGLAMDNGNYELAARIWLSLKKDAYWSESSATAQLGFPMSLEQMAWRQQALAEYRATEARYQTRLAELEGLVQKADDRPGSAGSSKYRIAAIRRGPRAGRAPRCAVDGGGDPRHTDWLEWS